MSDTSSLPTQVFCTQCGRPFPVDDLLRFGDSYVCADCKPSFVQRVREGETVGPTMVYASFGARFVALLIDGIIYFIASLVISFSTGLSGALTTTTSIYSLGTLMNMVIDFAYYVFMLKQYGATLGKMAMGVKIVTADGGPLSYGRAVARYFCATFLEAFTLGIGFLIALFDEQNRTLHDRICGTRAITTR